MLKIYQTTTTAMKQTTEMARIQLCMEIQHKVGYLQEAERMRDKSLGEGSVATLWQVTEALPTVKGNTEITLTCSLAKDR